MKKIIVISSLFCALLACANDTAALYSVLAKGIPESRAFPMSIEGAFYKKYCSMLSILAEGDTSRLHDMEVLLKEIKKHQLLLIQDSCSDTALFLDKRGFADVHLDEKQQAIAQFRQTGSLSADKENVCLLSKPPMNEASIRHDAECCQFLGELRRYSFCNAAQAVRSLIDRRGVDALKSFERYVKKNAQPWEIEKIATEIQMHHILKRIYRRHV